MMNEDSAPTIRGFKIRQWLTISLAFVIIVVALSVMFWNTDPEVTLREGQLAFARLDYETSLACAERVLKVQARHPAALILAGDTCFATDRFDKAFDYYIRVANDRSLNAMHAQLRCGRIQMYHRGNAVAAEEHYREVIAIQPDHQDALFQLASLLGIQSRRHEAVPLVLRLFRTGAFHRDFLPFLRSPSAALRNLDEINRYSKASPDDSRILVGLAWNARTAGDQEQALKLLDRAVGALPALPEAHWARISLLWDMRRIDDLRSALNAAQSIGELDSRSWIVRGRLAQSDGQSAAAIRCFWEAYQKDPTSRQAAYELYQYCMDTGDEQSAESFALRIANMQAHREAYDFAISKQHSDLTPLWNLIDCCERCGRLWEAWGWCQVALETSPNDAISKARADRIHQQLQGADLKLVCGSEARTTVDLAHLPLPVSRPEQRDQGDASWQPIDPRPTSISFRDDASSSGLEFEYFQSPSPKSDGQRMYEFNGGGCGILDLDADGWPDVYLTQGTSWPVNPQNHEFVDRQFRNLGNGRFADVTGFTGIDENRFSTGIAIGDFDGDGFDDLYVANIGMNRLYKNQGDGTFRDVTAASQTGDAAWSTSSLMADLNRDGLPEIYSVNYLKGPGVFETVCQHDDGRPRMCMPFHFDAAEDRLFLNTGDGRFTDVSTESGIARPDGKGLGIVAADFDQSGRLSLFIANDTVPNFLLSSSDQSRGAVPLLDNRALPAGVALNRDGRAEGCMGIAVGDPDSNGFPDLFITNFLNETNTFYANRGGLLFDDETDAAGLGAPSIEMLGFGTQFLDADLDGREDLIVTNGHIDDYREYGRPYEMPAQFFWNAGTARFTEIPPESLGPYFNRRLLGRSLARVDWNRDGMPDAVVTHLDSPTALLTNTSQTRFHRIVVRLVGIESCRTPIGATVRVRTANQEQIRQLTAGDGYQASCQHALFFGLNRAERIEALSIHWPSGQNDEFSNLAVDREYLFVEGSQRALSYFELVPPTPGPKD